MNPEAPWPEIVALAATCREEGFTLRERLAIYPEYVRQEFLDPCLAGQVAGLASVIDREASHAAIAH